MMKIDVRIVLLILIVLGIVFIVSGFLPSGFNIGVGLTLILCCGFILVYLGALGIRNGPHADLSTIRSPSIDTSGIESIEDDDLETDDGEGLPEVHTGADVEIPVKAIPYSVRIENRGERRKLYLQALRLMGHHVSQDTGLSGGTQVYRVGKELQYVKESKFHSESNHFWFGLYTNPLNAIKGSESYIVLLIEKGEGEYSGFDVIRIPVGEIMSRLGSFSLDTHDQYHINIEGQDRPAIIDSSGRSILALDRFLFMRFRYPHSR